MIRALKGSSVMQATIGSLNSFLAKSRSLKPDHLHVVLGNEACDMDSTVASIVYAYFLSELDGIASVAVINVDKDDFALRTDVVHLLKKVSLNQESLLFMDEALPMLESHANKKALSLHLVDHNRLSVKQQHWEPHVVEIVDHHKDEGLCGNVVPTKRNIVFPQGSCCSLVSQYAHGRGVTWDSQMAQLLLAVILIDTGNLDPVMGKTEAIDRDMVSLLTRAAGLEDVAKRDSFYHELNDAKFDVAALSCYDNLRKDYKEFSVANWKIGMSAVLRNVQDFDGETLQRDVQRWIAAQHLDVFFILTAFYEGPNKTFRRQNCIFADRRNEHLFHETNAFIQSQKALKLEPLKNFSFPSILGSGYDQWDVKASRKQLQPMVMDFFATQSKI